MKKKKKAGVIEEKAGVGGEILVLVSMCNPTGAFFGQNLGFCPRNAREIAPNSARAEVGQKWGVSECCIMTSFPVTIQISDARGSLSPLYYQQQAMILLEHFFFFLSCHVVLPSFGVTWKEI